MLFFLRALQPWQEHRAPLTLKGRECVRRCATNSKLTLGGCTAAHLKKEMGDVRTTRAQPDDTGIIRVALTARPHPRRQADSNALLLVFQALAI